LNILKTIGFCFSKVNYNCLWIISHWKLKTEKSAIETFREQESFESRIMISKFVRNMARGG
jgi:hypothetical protein